MIIISFPKNVAKQTMHGPYYIAFAQILAVKRLYGMKLLTLAKNLSNSLNMLQS